MQSSEDSASTIKLAEEVGEYQGQEEEDII
jgi:hypothetical protein